MRHLSTQDPSVLENLVNAVASAESSRQVDLENYDYASLPVEQSATWVVQLVHMGYQDATGRVSDSGSPESQPTFQVFVCAYLLRFLQASPVALNSTMM